MTPSSSWSESPVNQRAEALFLEFLQESEEGDSADFEELCARHPELTEELCWLHERHEQADAMLRQLHGNGEVVETDEPRLGGRYEILGEIARGGMGRVLEVKDHELDRVLAMKVLRDRADSNGDELARQRTRMVNEAHILGRLEHPGIVPIHEVGSDAEGRPYFTMLRVRGKALSEIFDDVKAGRDGWTTTRAVDLLLRVCEAVAHAHSKGIVHRDLKPANVMVGPFGEVFVMDWGLAKVRDGTDAADIRLRTTSLPSHGEDVEEDASASPVLTMDGDVLGTPSYMSPEQAQGSIADVGEHSDVYSVGAMLYHLLSGRAPYVAAGTSSTPKEILEAVLRGDPEPLEQIAPDATRELASVCTKAMARERDQRYASMRALADDLRAFLENRVVRAHATGAMVELVKWMQRHRGVVAVLGLLLVVLVGSTIVFASLYGIAERRLAFLEQNPSGFRIDFSGIPSLPSFVEDFDDGELDPHLRMFHSPENIECEDGKLVLHRRGPKAQVVLGQSSSTVIRGDFELSLSFELEGFSVPTVGCRVIGLSLRRARDGLPVASVQRQNGGMPFDAGYAATDESGDHHFERWDQPAGRLRLAREGNLYRAEAWCDEWQTLFEEEGSDEPLELYICAASDLGDEGEFRAAIDDLRFESHSGAEGEGIGPIVETFDEDLGPYLLPWGTAGVAAAVDGRLEIENFPDVLGESSVTLDFTRHALRGDFDVSLDFEIVDSSGPAENVDFEFHVPGVAHLSCSARTPGILLARRSPSDPAVRAELPSNGPARLRIHRLGSRVSMEHWDGQWREVLSTTASAEDLKLVIGLSNQRVAAGAVVTIDDLRIEGLVRRP